jgi:hypothetical protein
LRHGTLVPKPPTDFASVARRAVHVVGEGSDASDHPDHLEIVNVSRSGLFKVWFSKNGVRYVVVTLQEHEAWLANT